MMQDHEEEWELLCRQAAQEHDSDRLQQLIGRINELLTAKEKRLQERVTSERGDCVFQIAYDLMQLVTRARLLKRQGYDVVSAFGSETAKHLLGKNPDYSVRLFILGHNAAKEAREEMAQWLREHFPSAKILALNAPQDKLVGADWNFLVNSAEEWLPAIAAA